MKQSSLSTQIEVPILLLLLLNPASSSSGSRLCFAEPCGNIQKAPLLPTWDSAELYFSSVQSQLNHGDALEALDDKQFSGMRHLLQFQSSSILISSADTKEGLLITHGCAISLTMSIGRGCAIIAETVPYYYIDQVTRFCLFSDELDR